jgi:lipopolysaccharide heptosyltransferase III
LGCFPRIAPLSLAGGRVRDGDPTANVRPRAERLPVGPSLGCSQTGFQHPAGVGAMTAMKEFNTDCRFDRTDRPCDPHKNHGYMCTGCSVYDRIGQRVLIIKLDATGDVLRTTVLLRPLKQALPGSHVTWITRREALEVLTPNRWVDRVLPLDAEALLVLGAEVFDVVLNPDASIVSCRLATTTRGCDKRGLVLDENAGVVPLNEDARRWYEMGLNDPLKKQNRRTDQSILLGICGLPPVEHPISWEIVAEEAQFAAAFAARHGLRPECHPVIGLNTGAGGRWRWKKWTESGYAELIDAILDRYPDARVLLYGGPEERERNERLAKSTPGRLVDTDTDNTLRRFEALVDLCDVMMTGDTMALHIAAALEKRIVALVGPTSAAEIELYGRGTKVAPWEMPCLGCYLSDCDICPAWMERVSATDVFQALQNEVVQLEQTGRRASERKTGLPHGS